MTCRVCNSPDLDLVVDLGSQPWCNHFLRGEEVGTEPFYPLRVVYCLNCATAQIDYTVRKEIMFGDHTYLSGVTNSLSAHFRRVAVEADARFLQGAKTKSVLDIGSNKGVEPRGVLVVSRNSKLVAKVRVASVQPDRSIANIIPGWKLDEVMEGDQVFY